MNLSGCFTAITTPFNGRSVDERALAEHAAWMVDQGVSGVVVCGTTGESATMTDDEKIRSMNVVFEAVGHRATVVGGAGNNCTEESLEFIRRVNEEARVHAIMSVVPYYVKPTQAGCVAHFAALSDASRNPVVVYNVPGRTVVNMTADTMLRCAAHPNVCGIKEASADMLQGTLLMERLPSRVAVMSGDDATSALLMFAGARGVISVVSNIAPKLVSDLCAAVAKGDVSTARTLHTHMCHLHNIVFEQANPIPVKALVARLGFGDGTLRLPLLAMEDALTDALWSRCQALGVAR
ncbi:MAG: 4-hydroxy-tetrahydrodipicolinate synthase [Myxococcales bacterium]|nr:4-hydroxy-tetrahydrodipicolinate synthase [Myxococcales bacterium]